jgi:hypothetical protein
MERDMDHIRIIKRALSITTSYRALWVFGILVALTTGGRISGGGSNGGGGGGGSGAGPGAFPRPQISPDVLTGLIVAGVVFLCVVLLLAAAATIARYVAETALIRMVDQHEATGMKVSVRQGFRLGWSRAALRLFLMDLVVGLSVFVAFLLLLLLAASPLLVWLTDSTPARVLGTLVAVALAVVSIFALIMATIALSLLVQFWHRAVVLEDRRVSEAMRRGWQLLRRRLGDVVVMGLILFALGLALTIVMVPLIFLLVAVAAIGGGLPALLVYAVGRLIAQGAAPWIAAIIVGLPIFIAIMAVPLAILGGLVQTFQSSTWTLTYRELLALEAARPAPGGGDLPPAAGEQGA